MDRVFAFALRLLICFLAAKFILNAVGLEGWRTYLLGLTGLFLANLYGIEYLVFREGSSFRGFRGDLPRPAAAPDLEAAPPEPTPSAPGAAEPPAGPAAGAADQGISAS